jgi:hypothetical protein
MLRSFQLQLDHVAKPFDAFLDASACQSRTADNLVLALESAEFQQFGDFFEAACSLEVVFVGIEQEGDPVRDARIIQNHLQLAFGNFDSHFVAAVHYEDNAMNDILLIPAACVGLPKISVFGLARHVQNFEVDADATEGVLLESDGGRYSAGSLLGIDDA